eukprot:PhM_4_TR8110/c0_g2_i1/m.66205
MTTPLYDSLITRMSATPEWHEASGYITGRVAHVLNSQKDDEEGEWTPAEALPVVVSSLEHHAAYDALKGKLTDTVSRELADRAREHPGDGFLKAVRSSSARLLVEIYLMQPVLRPHLHTLMINTPLTDELRRHIWGCQLSAGVPNMPQRLAGFTHPLLQATALPSASDALIRSVAVWPHYATHGYEELNTAAVHRALGHVVNIVMTALPSVTLTRAISLCIPLVAVFGTALDLRTFTHYVATMLDGVGLLTEMARSLEGTRHAAPSAVFAHLPTMFVDAVPKRVLLHLWDQLLLTGFRCAPSVWAALASLVDKTWDPRKLLAVSNVSFGGAFGRFYAAQDNSQSSQSAAAQLDRKRWLFGATAALAAMPREDRTRRGLHTYIGSIVYKRFKLEQEMTHHTRECVRVHFGMDRDRYVLFLPLEYRSGDLDVSLRVLTCAIVMNRENLQTLQRIIRRVHPLRHVFCANHPIAVPDAVYYAISVELQRLRRGGGAIGGVVDSSYTSADGGNKRDVCSVRMCLHGIEYEFPFTQIPPTAAAHVHLVTDTLAKLGWVKLSAAAPSSDEPPTPGAVGDAAAAGFCPHCNDYTDANFDPLAVQLCTCPTHHDWATQDHVHAMEQIGPALQDIQAWLARQRAPARRYGSSVKGQRREDVPHLDEDAERRRAHTTHTVFRALRQSVAAVTSVGRRAREQLARQLEHNVVK